MSKGKSYNNLYKLLILKIINIISGTEEDVKRWRYVLYL